MNRRIGTRAILSAIVLLTIVLGGALHEESNGALHAATVRIPQPVGTAQGDGSAPFIPTPSVPRTLYAKGASDLRVHAVAVDAVGARFTADEVRQSLQGSSPLVTPSGAVPPISRIVFLTAAQASATLLGGEPTGRPDTDLVCYVEFTGPISGNFILSAPGVRMPTSYSKGVLVFDATTGNLLIRSVSGA